MKIYRTDRRNFLNGIAATSFKLTVFPAIAQGNNTLRRYEYFLFKNARKVYNIYNYGVIGDGKTLNTNVIQNLIDTCTENGGGTIFFPTGSYLTGTIQVKDNVNLNISAGATIRGSPDLNDYKFGCLIYTEDAREVFIHNCQAP